MLLAPELVLFLGSEKYRDAIPAVYPVMLGGFFAMAYALPAVVEYYKKKTGAIALGTVLAAVINLALNGIYIPKYGYIAAAYTTFVSYLLYYIFHTLVAYKLEKILIVPLWTNGLCAVILIVGTILSIIFQGKIVVRAVSLIFILSLLCIYMIREIKELKERS